MVIQIGQVTLCIIKNDSNLSKWPLSRQYTTFRSVLQCKHFSIEYNTTYIHIVAPTTRFHKVLSWSLHIENFTKFFLQDLHDFVYCTAHSYICRLLGMWHISQAISE